MRRRCKRHHPETRDAWEKAGSATHSSANPRAGRDPRQQTTEEQMNVRAKFTVTKSAIMGYSSGDKGIVQMCYRDGKPTEIPAREITMSAVYGTAGENASFAEATPSGEIKFILNNPDLQEVFQPGQTYYVDFTPAA
jgi:hypothetical protein